MRSSWQRAPASSGPQNPSASHAPLQRRAGRARVVVLDAPAVGRRRAVPLVARVAAALVRVRAARVVGPARGQGANPVGIAVAGAAVRGARAGEVVLDTVGRPRRAEAADARGPAALAGVLAGRAVGEAGEHDVRAHLGGGPGRGARRGDGRANRAGPEDSADQQRRGPPAPRRPHGRRASSLVEEGSFIDPGTTSCHGSSPRLRTILRSSTDEAGPAQPVGAVSSAKTCSSEPPAARPRARPRPRRRARPRRSSAARPASAPLDELDGERQPLAGLVLADHLRDALDLRPPRRRRPRRRPARRTRTRAPAAPRYSARISSMNPSATRRPRAMTSARVQVASTSDRMWVERRTVWSSPSLRTRARTSRIWLGSRPAVGSSRMRMAGRRRGRRRGPRAGGSPSRGGR